MIKENLLLYFCGSIFFTFLIGMIILVFFWRDKICRFVGFFTIKPVVAYLLSLIIWWNLNYWRISNLYIYPSRYFWYAIHFVIETCLLIVMVFWFADLRHKLNRLFNLLICFDVLRWCSTLFLFSDIGLFHNAGIAYFVLFVFPVIYATVALIFVVTQIKKLETAP